MVGDDDEALYVGKARNLKARVTSYFRASGLTAKTIALTNKVRDIQITVTGSETEALLLEQSLIKELKPRFNVVLRDDKSYPFIHLTEHPYPRLTFHRGAKKEGRYFGPFPQRRGSARQPEHPAKAVWHSSVRGRLLQEPLAPVPTTPDQALQCALRRPDRPRPVRRRRAFGGVVLEGKSADVLGEFKARMEAASADLAFERAARYRDQIGHLRRTQENQYVHGDGGDVDIFGVAVGSGHACVQGLFVRDGRLLGHRTWFPKNELAVDEGELLFAFSVPILLGQRRPRDTQGGGCRRPLG